MGTVETRVLVVAPRPGSGDVAAPLQALGCRLVAADVPGAMVELAAAGARALVVDAACSDADLGALVDAGRRRGVAAFLGQRTADAAGYRRALAAGCRGVLAATDDTEQARAVLAVAQDQQRRHALEVQDFQALHSRYE